MRSEPEILADLIRLADRKERAIDAMNDAPPSAGQSQRYTELANEVELIEEARAALHKHATARHELDASLKQIVSATGQVIGATNRLVARAPISWWSMLCLLTGYVEAALIYGSTQWPLLVVIPCGGLFLLLISLIADWRVK